MNGVIENKKHWLELAQTAQETKKNRKNSLRTLSNGGNMNNNNTYSYTNGISNNNNGDEISNASSESNLVSKIVGKFPLDVNGITTSSFLTMSSKTTFIKPENGLIASFKSPSIVTYTSWKKKDGHHEAVNQ